MRKYHVIVIGIYIILIPVIILFLPGNYSYTLPSGDYFSIFSVFTLALFLEYIFFKRKSYKVQIQFSKILKYLTYGIIFAIPEEIIFRGLIQNYLNHIIDSIPFVILLSALIFGVAHFLNDSKGFSPSKWNWKLILLVSIAGIPLGTIFTITNSLLIPTILHIFLIVILRMFYNDTLNNSKKYNNMLHS